MKCTSCGNMISENAKFCRICGAAITKPEPQKEVFDMPDLFATDAEANAKPQSRVEMYDDRQNYGNQAEYENQENFDEPLKRGRYDLPIYNEGDGSPRYVGFADAIKLFFNNCFNFKGRSTRSEFWWVQLFTGVITIIIFNILNILSANEEKIDKYGFVGIVSLVLSAVLLILAIPSISLIIRRLHDVGKSGNYFWFVLIPTIGIVILIVFLSKESEDNANPWGTAPNPDTRPGMFL